MGFTSRQVRNLYGATVEEYDVPSVCFSLYHTYIYTTSTLTAAICQKYEQEDRAGAKLLSGQVAVFEMKTGAKILDLPIHEKAVRTLSRHPFTEALVTGSFDKTVKFWN